MQSLLTAITVLLIYCTSFGSALKCVLCYGGDVTPLCNDDQYSKHNFLQLSICSPPNSSHIPVCMKRKQIDATGAGPVEFRKCTFMPSDAALTCENRTEGNLTYRECYCNNADGCNGSSYHTWSLSICTVSVLISCLLLRKIVG